MLPARFSFAPIIVLLAAAVLEVAINRIMIGSVRDPGLVAAAVLVPDVEPPGWYTALSYAGLFLFYFTGVLAAVAACAITNLTGGNLAVATACARPSPVPRRWPPRCSRRSRSSRPCRRGRCRWRSHLRWPS